MNRKSNTRTLGLLAGLSLGLLVGATGYGQQIDPFSSEFQAKASPAKRPAADDPFAVDHKLDLKAPKPEPKVAAKPSQKSERPRSVREAIRFQVTVEPNEARPGQVVKLIITGTPEPGFHTYAFTKRTREQTVPGQNIGVLKIIAIPQIKPLWPLSETEPSFVKEEVGKGIWEVYLEHEGTFKLSQDLYLEAKTAEGILSIPLTIALGVCDKRGCLYGKIELKADVQVKGKPIPPTAEIENRLKEKQPEVAVVAPPASVAAGASPGGGASTGLIAFILSGIFWGAVSLITPCVFPMIPITVSFFLKQSEKEHHRPITMATVYCGTIVIVLTIAAVALLSVFRALSVNPIMNFVIGGLFVFFALSLFGMYEIELPSGLARFTSAREGKGGLLGTMFMALTFTIISFACVAPFLGGFGGTAANSNLTLGHRILGGLAFAVTFASPFFILALFPTLLRKMPKSGSWLNTVKVVMGFLELAAALKFFRAGELVIVSQPDIFTYDFVLGLYIALSLLCGLYLIGVFRLPHDSPMESLSVPRMLVSLAFIGLAFYLAPALFKQGERGQNQRPAGAVFAWLDSFLLPEDQESELPWVGNLDKGLADARAKRKLVFVDFTGVTCTNCKINERNVFTQSTIKDLLKKYELVQLYTDVVPDRYYPPDERAKLGNGTGQQRADAQKNLELQRSKFGTEQLPLYVILEPLADGSYREVDKYEEGRIIDQMGFIQFLQRPLGQTQDRVSLESGREVAKVASR